MLFNKNEALNLTIKKVKPTYITQRDKTSSLQKFFVNHHINVLNLKDHIAHRTIEF